MKLDTPQPPLIYVYIGKRLPKYALGSLSGAADRAGCSVILLTNTRKAKGLDARVTRVDLTEFYKESDFKLFSERSQLDPHFRSGFWLHAAERLFILKQYLDWANIDKFFHAELDVFIFSLSLLSEKLDAKPQALFVPRDHQDRAIASLIYGRNREGLNLFLEYALANADFGNEMELLARFMDSNPSAAIGLPTGSRSNLEQVTGDTWPTLSVSDCGGIFDAAAIGQWLFGIDPRNKAGVTMNHFINEKWDNDPANFKFSFENGQLHASTNSMLGTATNLYCVHVHSKINNKLENPKTFAKIIDKSNKGQRSFVALNVTSLGSLLLTAPKVQARRALKLVKILLHA